MMWSARVPSLLGLSALIIMLGGFGVWASQSTLSGGVLAYGTIETRQRTTPIQHPTGGTVYEVKVNIGSVVSKGDVLVQIDKTPHLIKLNDLNAQIYALMATAHRLQSEKEQHQSLIPNGQLSNLAAQDPVFDSFLQTQTALFRTRANAWQQEKDQIQNRVRQTHQQELAIQAGIQGITHEIALSKEEFNRQSALAAKGLVSRATMTSVEQVLSRQATQKSEFLAQLARVQEQRAELIIQETRRNTERTEQAIQELDEVNLNLLRLKEERVSLLDQMERLTIRAPFHGMVQELRPITAGTVIRPGEVFANIAPLNQPLIIRADLPPIHRDLVFEDQAVDLVFPAFDTRTAPRYSGTITSISADILGDPSDGSAQYSLEITMPADISGSEVFSPGLSVQAFIKTHERTPLAYLTQPFIDYFRIAMGET